MISNREIVISIPSEMEEPFAKLCGIFLQYWGQAEPMSEDVLRKYERIHKKYKVLLSQAEFDNELHKEIQRVAPSGIKILIIPFTHPAMMTR